MVELLLAIVAVLCFAFLGYLFGWVHGWSAASALRDEQERAVHGLPDDPPADVPDLPRGKPLRPGSGRRVFEPMTEPPSKPASKEGVRDD